MTRDIVRFLALGVSIILLAAFMGCAPITTPSALEIEERKAELLSKAQELRPSVNAAKGVPACQAALTEIAERENVLDNALLAAAMRGESGQREVYSILGKKLKLIDRMEGDLDACLAETERAEKAAIGDVQRAKEKARQGQWNCSDAGCLEKASLEAQKKWDVAQTCYEGVHPDNQPNEVYLRVIAANYKEQDKYIRDNEPAMLPPRLYSQFEYATSVMDQLAYTYCPELDTFIARNEEDQAQAERQIRAELRREEAVILWRQTGSHSTNCFVVNYNKADPARRKEIDGLQKEWYELWDETRTIEEDGELNTAFQRLDEIVYDVCPELPEKRVVLQYDAYGLDNKRIEAEEQYKDMYSCAVTANWQMPEGVVYAEQEGIWWELFESTMLLNHEPSTSPETLDATFAKMTDIVTVICTDLEERKNMAAEQDNRRDVALSRMHIAGACHKYTNGNSPPNDQAAGFSDAWTSFNENTPRHEVDAAFVRMDEAILHICPDLPGSGDFGQYLLNEVGYLVEEWKSVCRSNGQSQRSPAGTSSETLRQMDQVALKLCAKSASP